MSRAVRMTKQQKDHLVGVLETRRYLVESRPKNAGELQRFEEHWRELAEQLNSIEGARKTVKQWRESLNDFKASTKKKARLRHLSLNETGGGPNTSKDLTPVEERLINLMSPIIITGIPDLEEPGLQEEIILPVREEILPDENLMGNNLFTATTTIMEDEEQSQENDILNVSMNSTTRQGKKKERLLQNLASQQEQCLLALTNSNVVLANAVGQLTAKLRRKRPRSAALQLKFKF